MSLKLQFLTLLTSGLLLTSISIASADVVGTSTTLLTNSQANPGTALVDLTPGSAAASGTSLALPGLTLGDGTVEEYVFVNGVGTNDAAAGSANVYTSLGAGISTPTFTAGTLGGSDQFAFVTDSTGTAFTSSTGIRGSNISWTVDTSAYDSGTVYAVFGTFQDFNQVAVTASGAGGTGSTLISDFLGITDSGTLFDTTGTPFDFSGTSLAGNGTAIAAFDFDNAGNNFDFTDLNFQQINTDLDGSRARFYGVIVNGVVAVVPEPSSLVVLGLGFLGLCTRRRK